MRHDGTPDAREFDQLADFIRLGETKAALQLLHDLFPDRAPWPAHVERRIADRQAEPARRFT